LRPDGVGQGRGHRAVSAGEGELLPAPQLDLPGHERGPCARVAAHDRIRGERFGQTSTPSLPRAAIVIATRHRRSSGTPPGSDNALYHLVPGRVMDRRSSLLILASGNHGGALVFAIGVGVVLLIAIYMFAKGRR
jgi:hypothetical protein